MTSGERSRLHVRSPGGDSSLGCRAKCRTGRLVPNPTPAQLGPGACSELAQCRQHRRLTAGAAQMDALIPDPTRPHLQPARVPWCPLHGLWNSSDARLLTRCRSAGRLGASSRWGRRSARAAGGRWSWGMQSYIVVCVKDTSSVTYITCRPWEARGVTMTAGGGDGAKRGNREHQQVEVGGGQVAEGSGGVGRGPGVRPASVGGRLSQATHTYPNASGIHQGPAGPGGLFLGSSLGRPLGSWWL